MGHCTMPRAFGIRKWLEAKFDDIFEQHDINYANADISRFKADCYLASALVARGWPYLAIVIYTAVRLFGARNYNRRQS